MSDFDKKKYFSVAMAGLYIMMEEIKVTKCDFYKVEVIITL
jgi:hypothetical protein